MTTPPLHVAVIRRGLLDRADKPRLFKEEKTYRVEAEDQRKVLAKLKDDDADGADIRNAVGGLWSHLRTLILGRGVQA